MIEFRKAVKHEAKGRIGLIGPSGSGKTYTALKVASVFCNKIAVVDTERGSASKYADLFTFDVLELDTFKPDSLVEIIAAVTAACYDCLIIDSLSHFWMGKDGALEQVDKASKRSGGGNSFAGWRDVTPMHNKMIDSIIGSKLHIIATMRSKTEWVVEKDAKGKSVPRKVGMQPIQRDGLEYEFDVVCDLDLENNLVVGKTRCPQLKGGVFPEAGKDFADIFAAWLTGEKRVEAPPPHPQQPKADNPDWHSRMVAMFHEKQIAMEALRADGKAAFAAIMEEYGVTAPGDFTDRDKALACLAKVKEVLKGWS
jgi:hypothetical protein